MMQYPSPEWLRPQGTAVIPAIHPNLYQTPALYPLPWGEQAIQYAYCDIVPPPHALYTVNPNTRPFHTEINQNLANETYSSPYRQPHPSLLAEKPTLGVPHHGWPHRIEQAQMVNGILKQQEYQAEQKGRGNLHNESQQKQLNFIRSNPTNHIEQENATDNDSQEGMGVGQNTLSKKSQRPVKKGTQRRGNDHLKSKRKSTKTKGAFTPFKSSQSFSKPTDLRNLIGASDSRNCKIKKEKLQCLQISAAIEKRPKFLLGQEVSVSTTGNIDHKNKTFKHHRVHLVQDITSLENSTNGTKRHRTNELQLKKNSDDNGVVNAHLFENEYSSASQLTSSLKTSNAEMHLVKSAAETQNGIIEESKPSSISSDNVQAPKYRRTSSFLIDGQVLDTKLHNTDEHDRVDVSSIMKENQAYALSQQAIIKDLPNSFHEVNRLNSDSERQSTAKPESHSAAQDEKYKYSNKISATEKVSMVDSDTCKGFNFQQLYSDNSPPNMMLSDGYLAKLSSIPVQLRSIQNMKQASNTQTTSFPVLQLPSKLEQERFYIAKHSATLLNVPTSTQLNNLIYNKLLANSHNIEYASALPWQTTPNANALDQTFQKSNCYHTGQLDNSHMLRKMMPHLFERISPSPNVQQQNLQQWHLNSSSKFAASFPFNPTLVSKETAARALQHAIMQIGGQNSSLPSTPTIPSINMDLRLLKDVSASQEVTFRMTSALGSSVSICPICGLKGRQSATRSVYMTWLFLFFG